MVVGINYNKKYPWPTCSNFYDMYDLMMKEPMITCSPDGERNWLSQPKGRGRMRTRNIILDLVGRLGYKIVGKELKEDCWALTSPIVERVRNQEIQCRTCREELEKQLRALYTHLGLVYKEEPHLGEYPKVEKVKKGKK